MGEIRYQIAVNGTDIQFECSEDEFILHAMIRAGKGPVQHGCCGGGCGVCKMRVQSGSVVVEKRMSRAHVSQVEEEQGIALICCIKPRGDIVLARV